MRGKLTIFLGYAAGVGKTYQMLTEAAALRASGRDVAIGYFEPHGRVETIARTEGMEFVPRAIFEYRGSRFEDMDTAAVIRRHPQVAVVDEFAHTNAPGAERKKRWEDVMLILDSGIDVLTSLNVQHIESLNDQVMDVTGIRVRETVPDWVVRDADQVVLVDVTPRALLHRMERGVVYAPEKARQALENFFTEPNLTALRELAIRQTAQSVEEPAAAPREHLLLWLTPCPSTAMLIRRARRVSDYLGAPCTAVYLERDAGEVDKFVNFCRNLRIETTELHGADPMQSIAEYARETGATQLFVTRDAPRIDTLVNLARDLKVTIVARSPAR